MATHSVEFKPYTLTWDGSQWVVKKTVARTNSEGEREQLVGYYSFLDSALRYGVIQDDANVSGRTSAHELVERMEHLWQDIKEEAKTWPALPATTRVGRAPGATPEDGEADSQTPQEEPGTGSDATSASSRASSGTVTTLPENKPPRTRKPRVWVKTNQ